jgi:hypothetical protein
MNRAILLATVAMLPFAASAQTSSEVTPGQGSATDARGNSWSITGDGSVVETREWKPNGNGADALMLIDGKVYAEDSAGGGWFMLSKDRKHWTSVPAPPGAQSNYSSAPVSQPAPADTSPPAISGGTDSPTDAVQATSQPDPTPSVDTPVAQTASTQPNTTGPTQACAVSAAQVPGAAAQTQNDGVLLGAMIGDPGTDGGKANLSSFVKAMGQSPPLVVTYLDDRVPPDQWGDSARYSAHGLTTLSQANVTPVVGIPMGVEGRDGSADFKAIVRGEWDTALNKAFQAYVDKGFKGFYIRPGWEMNGTWYPWSVNPGNAADFKAAFAHIADLAHHFSGALISVVWNPGYVTSSTSYMSIYPGDQYVDHIGIDTYGAASGVPDTAPFATAGNPNTFTLQDAIALAKKSGKSLSFPETGGGPGDAAFPENLASVLEKSEVKVGFVAIWDNQSGCATNCFWSDDPTSAEAWKKAFAKIAAASAKVAGSRGSAATISSLGSCPAASGTTAGTTTTYDAQIAQVQKDITQAQKDLDQLLKPQN